MWKKISIQLILFSLALFVIFFAYKVYINPKNNIETENVELTKPKNNEKIDFIESKNDEKKANALDDVEENETSLIKNLKYISKDAIGNEYVIESKFSEISQSNDDIINMRQVNAEIIMVNSEPIFITSDFAIYNNENYETIFSGNVVINHIDNKITCENFSISIENNLAYVSENVIFENSKGKLIADTIEIDLITKNSKIFMNDKNKKVIVLNK
tara:strand:- start:379 stop:1023 length:645 start_codon:yes stop_codon:yes gene_type:complete